MTKETFTSNQIWTVLAGVISVIIKAWRAGGGLAHFNIWPQTRRTHVDGAPLVITNAVGYFRPITPIEEWSIDTALHYGLTLEGIEAR